MRLLFGRVAATMQLRVPRRARPDSVLEIAGVDTTRLRGRLMVFTPAYHQHTDTPATGLEWVVQGKPLRVTSGPLSAGKTPIPRDGYVLSFGGTKAPPALQSLRVGSRVELDTNYNAIDGSEDDWQNAEAIVGGAGLLLRDGQTITDWKVEQLSQTFAQTRHPRTLVGTHSDGSVWLVTVDGRQPKLSAGMSLYELRALARRLGLTKRTEPGRRRIHDDVGGRKDRQQPVGRCGAEESERRADRDAAVRRAADHVLRATCSRPPCHAGHRKSERASPRATHVAPLALGAVARVARSTSHVSTWHVSTSHRGTWHVARDATLHVST